MFGPKGLLALAAVIALAQCAHLGQNDREYLESLLESVRELEEHLPQLEDLHPGESEIAEKRVEPSREELEEDTGKADGSLSQESTKEETTKKPETEVSKGEESDEEEDDDEDVDPMDLIPVRGLGSIFGNLPGMFGISQRKPWWSGPHVCVEREEKEEKSEDFGDSGFIAIGTAHFSSCQNTPSKYTCKTITKKSGVTKTAIVSYQCCHGFRRTANNPNCSKVETKPIYEIAAELGSDKFADMIRTSGLESELEGNVTVFLPTDEALSNHHATMDSMNQLDPVLTNEVSGSQSSGSKNDRSFVLAHVVDGVHEISDMTDEMVLKTRDDSTLRINFLPNRGVAVNCVRVNATDRLTQNGVVHLVEKVLEPPVRDSLADKLSKPKFEKFRQLLEENNLWELMSSDKGLTVFAVENEAVDELGSKYKMCMKNVLAHHILPHTLCSATADTKQELATLDLAKNWLPFSQVDGQMILANKTKVKSVDDVATNGILHVAEAFVVPSNARPISELLTKSEHKEWLSVLERSGLLPELETSENITMFVPTDSAVKEGISDDTSADDLKEIVKFHIGKDQTGHTVSTMLDGQNLTISAEKSMFPGLLGVGRFMSVQCAPITKMGGRVCNGLLHEIDSLLMPPKNSLWEFIEQNDKLSTLRKILKGTKLADEMKEGFSHPITFLAPSDDAFSQIGDENIEKLVDDKELADETLRSHVLKEPVCCSNVVPSTWPFVPLSQTLSSRAMEVNKRGDTAVFGSMPVTDCDNMVKGGIVHVVNGVRFTKNPSRDREIVLRTPNSEIILGGF